MELRDAEQLAVELMKQFGIASTWRFEFDNAVRRFGCCHRSQNLITLSAELVKRNEQPKVEDTIRHEIAHALCPPREGHGEVWKAMCLKVGAKPERCYNDEVDAPEGDWQARCNGCGKLHTKFRRPKRELWCGEKSCKHKHGRLAPIQKLVWRHKNALDLVAASQPTSVTVSPDARRAAIAAMKAQLSREQEMEEMKSRIAELESKLGSK